MESLKILVSDSVKIDREVFHRFPRLFPTLLLRWGMFGCIDVRLIRVMNYCRRLRGVLG